MKTTFAEKKRRLLRKIYGALSLTTFLFVFQACYGTPDDIEEDLRISGIVISAKTGQPVAGIKVTFDNQVPYQITDSKGEFRIYASLAPEYVVKFEDIDSDNNGTFLAKETVLKAVDGSAFLNISLNEK